ncbi:MAG: flagellar hook-length control protein FliK [Tissierellia bacterium]|nr:flagellar hook-length control protein FliK [Tissierellia bacterium]
MNISLNLNNFDPIQFSQNSFNQNQVLDVNKGGFLAMLQMAIAESSNYSEQGLSGDSANLNLEDMFLLSDSQPVNLLDQNTISIENMEEPGKLEKNEIIIDYKVKKSQNQEEDLEKLISLLGSSNFFNFNILNEKVKVDNVDNNEYKNHIFENYSFLHKMRNSENVKQTDIISKEEKLPETIVKEIPLESNVSESGLTKEIKSKNKGMNEFDYHELIVKNNKPLVEGEKIITISDESTEIKSQVLTQVKDKIIFMSGEGNISSLKEVTMELQPHNLGKVNIKMIFKDDKLTVEIKALNEETQKILSSNKEEITNALSKTVDGAVNIVVKPNEFTHENHLLNYYQNNSQNHEKTYDGSSNQKNGHNTHKNNYYQANHDDDDMIFSELINMSNITMNM